MSAESPEKSKREQRRQIMQKESFIRGVQTFKAEKAQVDAMMLDEFKVGALLVSDMDLSSAGWSMAVKVGSFQVCFFWVILENPSL